MKKAHYLYLVIITILFSIVIFDFFRFERIRNQLGIKSDNPNYIKKPSINEEIAMLINSSDYQARLFQKYLFDLSNNSTVGTDPVGIDTATYYYNWRLKFKKRLANSITGTIADTFKLDSTQAVLFEFPKFIKALTTTYGQNIYNANFWDDKGFIIYLGNYGNWGNKSQIHKYHSNVILQFARFGSVVAGEWTPENNLKAFDFGDIKPPKTFRGETIIIEN